MNHTKDCYVRCIPHEFLIPNALWIKIEEILLKIPYKASTGRPPLEAKRAINGIYYLLRTGIHWNALPRCFGSSSAIHRMFQKLVRIGFFKILWSNELITYIGKHPGALKIQALDCSHIKAPLGQEKTGDSPRNKDKCCHNKERYSSGLCIGPGNRHDSTLFVETLISIPIPEYYTCRQYREIQLDSAYDSEEVRTALFNLWYVPRIKRNKRKSKIPVPNIKTPARGIVESLHSWMNRFRRLLIRFEKYAANYLGLMHFAFGIIIFRKMRV